MILERIVRNRLFSLSKLYCDVTTFIGVKIVIYDANDEYYQLAKE